MSWTNQGRKLFNSLKFRLILSLMILHLASAFIIHSVLINRISHSQENRFTDQARASVQSAARVIERLGLEQAKTLHMVLQSMVSNQNILSLRLSENGAELLQVSPSAVFQRTVDNAYTILSSVNLPGRGALQLKVVFDRTTLDHEMENFSVYVAILMFLFVFIGAVGIFLVSGSLIRYLSGFKSRLKSIAEDSGEVPQYWSPLSEFQELGESLDSMTAELQLRNQLIVEKEQFNRSIMDSISDAVLIFDEYGAILDSNRSAQRMFDYSASQLLGINILELLKSPSEFFGSQVVRLKVFDITGGTHELRGCTSHNAEFQVMANISSFEVGLDICFVATIRQEAHTQNHFQGVYSAYYDSLTGLPNKELFYDRLKYAMLRTQRNQCSLALLYVDLDGFSRINETIGRRGADELLVLAANRITQCLRKSDSVARYSGDEFVVILESIENIETVETPARKILFALQQAFHINKKDVYTGCSIGISTFPGSVENMDDLVMEADMAMHKAKHSGGNMCELFTDEMRQDLKELNQRIRCLKWSN